MGLSKLWAKGPDGSRGFVFSHVKTIYYNWAQKKLLSTKLDEIDALIDQKIAKAMMSNVQVNDQNKVPTSALAYAMQQQITENEEAITGLNSEALKKDESNITSGQIVFTKLLGIGGDAYSNAPIYIRSPMNQNESTKAGIGFENVGTNAGVLWLNSDGRLHFTDHTNQTKVIAWTDDNNMKDRSNI